MIAITQKKYLMFIIHGTKTARIKRFTDNQQICKSCGLFDQNVKVYREYFHVMFIPIFPKNFKTVKIRCNNCGEPLRLDSLENHYTSLTKTPFYLYSGIILFFCLVFFSIFFALKFEREKDTFVATPRSGDVYTVRKDENNKAVYYFLRLNILRGDTLFLYHNNLEYSEYVTKLNDEDFFVKDEEITITKNDLKELLREGSIYSIDRDYDNSNGFNRIK